MPWSCGSAIASWVAGVYLVPRYGSNVMFVGLATLLLGVLSAVAVYAASSPTAYPWPLLIPLSVSGLGIGMFTVPFFTTALHRVRPRETGSAAGLLNAVQQLGGTLGIALLGTVFFSGTDNPGRAGIEPAALAAVQHAFWVAGGLVIAAGVAAGAMARPERSRPRVRQPRPTELAATPR
ncbi:MAG: MFS transporter [Terriglobales bacterium]